MFLEGKPTPGPTEDNDASLDWATAGYFETIGNYIVKGRPISERDTASSRHVAVINEAFARKFFQQEDPIGKHFGRSPRSAGNYEIVGVAKDAKYFTNNLQRSVRAMAFLPASQAQVFLHDVVIRMQPGAKLSDTQIRGTLAGVDPNMPMIKMLSLTDQVAGSFNQPRSMAQLTSLFGILALVLASIGIYGVTAYNVGSRTNEIGVRMALGAGRSHILTLILRGAFAVIAFGLLFGIPLTLIAVRFLGSQLYGINQYDPAILIVAIATLGSSALVAALIPAMRATSILPSQALRAD